MSEQDGQIGQNVRRLRGDISQDELAKRMREAGFSWTKMTVYNVERGDRQLKLSEARALLESLGYEDSANMSVLFSSDADIIALKKVRSLEAAIEAAEQCCTEIYVARYELEWYLSEDVRGETPDGSPWAMPTDDVMTKVEKAFAESSDELIIKKLRYWLNQYGYDPTDKHA